MAVVTSLQIGMGEIQVVRGDAVFTCLGLGSCIGICALDPVSHVGGMAHVMLPEAFPGRPIEKPGKFADSAVPNLLEMLIKAGARANHLVIAISGGAQVFQFGGEGSTRLEIGRRNALAVVEHLKAKGLVPKAQEVGGNLGRTVTLTTSTGLVTVRTVSQGEKTLCNLRA